MTRQLKISENVHLMLSLIKPFQSVSYDEVIRNLIEDTYPYLPTSIERIQQIESEDPSLAAEEWHELEQILFEDFMESRRVRKEREDEREIDKALEMKEREEEAEVDRYLEEQERMQLKREEEAIERSIEEQRKNRKPSPTTVTKETGPSPKKRSVKK
jgi:hypothetical protein